MISEITDDTAPRIRRCVQCGCIHLGEDRRPTDPPPLSECEHKWAPEMPELSLLVIDLGDSCVVKVEKGEMPESLKAVWFGYGGGIADNAEIAPAPFRGDPEEHRA